MSHVVFSIHQRLALIWAASCSCLCRGRQPVHFAREFWSRMKPVTRQRLQPGGLPVAKNDLRVIEFAGSGFGVLHLTWPTWKNKKTQDVTTVSSLLVKRNVFFLPYSRASPQCPSLREKSSKYLKCKNQKYIYCFCNSVLTTPWTKCDVRRENHMFCWPTASALGLLDAESKNFIFLLQCHCDLHVKCCRRMQPNVTGFWKVRMVDLDGFKQCKLGLRYVNFAPVQTATVSVLQGWDNEIWKTRRNQKKKSKLATQVRHTSGRKFTKQLQLQQAKML